MKETFLSLGGLSLGIKWLVDTRQALESETLIKIDWEMATLVCKLLWNMMTSLPDAWRASVVPQMEDLEEILEELVLLDREDNGGSSGQNPTEFSSVSLQLLEKASTLANQQ